MNTNLIHNIINILMILIAGATAILSAMGCTTLPNGELECTNITYLDPTTATLIITILGVIKMVINVVRDGIKGLVKEQPPVK